MSRQIQIRRGTATENNNFTGAIGEVTMDTTNKTLRIHDGTTRGGNEIMSKQNFNSHISNCITEIPQHINLTLSNGTLTLKSGSKIYVPNGTNQFDTIVIDSDKTKTYTGLSNSIGLVWVKPDKTIEIIYSDYVYSGSNAPTGYTYMLWYDTANNFVKFTTDSGTTWQTGHSLPIAIVTGTSSGLTEIKQVFNGFGFIGSTVFALPGVKGLMPNGRNTDGTLKNQSVTIQNVITKTIPSNTGWHYIVINDTGTNFDYATEFYIGTSLPSNAKTYSRFYNTDTNETYVVVSGNITKAIMFIPNFRTEHKTSNPYKVTSVQPINTFHAIDYNNTEFIAHQSMPSDKYIDLTLGASGTTYTAPADGYFTISKQAGASGEYLYMLNTSNNMNSGLMSSAALNCRCFLPVSKDNTITINYTLSGTTNTFRFIYTNGAK